jgi:hypothetical protein
VHYPTPRVIPSRKRGISAVERLRFLASLRMTDEDLRRGLGRGGREEGAAKGSSKSRVNGFKPLEQPEVWPNWNRLVGGHRSAEAPAAAFFEGMKKGSV